MHSLEGFPACYRHLWPLTCWGNMVAQASLTNSAVLLGQPLHAKACLASLLFGCWGSSCQGLPGIAWPRLAWHGMVSPGGGVGYSPVCVSEEVFACLHIVCQPAVSNQTKISSHEK